MKRLMKLILALGLTGAITGQAYGFGIGVWGGTSIAVSSDIENLCTAIETLDSAASCTQGGTPALGLDIWLFGLGPVDIGVGAAMVPIFKADYTLLSTAYTSKISALPITAQARFTVPVIGLFAGAGVGLASTKSEVTVGGVSTSSSGSNFALAAVAGWGIGLGPVSVEAAVRLYNLTSDSTDSAGNTTTNSILALAPGVGVTLKF